MSGICEMYKSSFPAGYNQQTTIKPLAYIKGTGEHNDFLIESRIMYFVDYTSSSSEPGFSLVIICLFPNRTEFMCLIAKDDLFM